MIISIIYILRLMVFGIGLALV